MKIYNNPSEIEIQEILKRGTTALNPIVQERVTDILKKVRLGGDKAIFKLTSEIDSVNLSEKGFRVSKEEVLEAEKSISQNLKDAIKVAIKNITAFHSAQKHTEIRVETQNGVECWQKAVPISQVGLYIPGGTAPLFSTVLMLAIPAKIAECPNITLCTPCDKNGLVAPEVLYSAQCCGVEDIYKIGGAMAIGAMAYGTETVSKVDKIFGPGNSYVTTAKQQVSLFDVAIDMPAGPSEVMVVADETADASFVASDLLSQAEHGADSQAIFVTTSEKLALEVEKEVQKQLVLLNRLEIASKSLGNSRLIVVENIDKMVDIINNYAPEHLIVAMDSPMAVVEKVVSAGSVFIGHYTPESAGDYASGTNHTLPTNGWATAYSGVNLDSFTKKITYQKITKQGLKNIGSTIEIMAEAEGLTAHKNAVSVRLKKI